MQITRLGFVFAFLALLASGLGIAQPAAAKTDELLGSYTAQISMADRFASDGYRLETAAQIVRQDRANYHLFGRRDADDQFDPWFGTADSRAWLQRMLEHPDAMTPATRDAIVNGGPLIRVEVYRNSVRVHILIY